MGYNDDSIVKVDQEFFEPFNSRQVKVVGSSSRRRMSGLPNSACARRTLTFWLPVRFSHLGIVEIGFNSKTIQKSSSIRFCFPSVHLCKFTFQFTGTDTVFISEVRFCIDSIFSFMISYSLLLPMITVSRTVYESYLK